MSRVDSIGLLYDVPMEEYHADNLCPEVSLSRGGIVTLLNEKPAHFAARNPRLTQWPDRIEEPTAAQDLGSVFHTLLLGKGSAYKVMDPSDFRNKDGSVAKTWGNADAARAKAEAESQGFVVIDRETYRDALNASEKAAAALKQRFGGWPIGDSEVTAIWQRQTAHGLIWCRARFDHFSQKACTILDPKSTATGIDDESLKKTITSNGNEIQAAWYIEAAETIFPELAGLFRFRFVCQEVEPPYGTRFVLASESLLTRARFRIDRAANIFAKCLRANEWPNYPLTDVTVSAPPWLESKWLEEELSEAV